MIYGLLNGDIHILMDRIKIPKKKYSINGLKKRQIIINIGSDILMELIQDLKLNLLVVIIWMLFIILLNLKRIVPNLINWTYEDGNNYDDLKELYLNVYSQFVLLVSTNVGGIYENLKSNDQDGDVYTHVPKNLQKKAIEFLNSHVFSSLDWLVNRDVLSKIENIGAQERVRSIQEFALRLFDYSRLARMLENESMNGKLAYSINEMIIDLDKSIWGDLETASPTNIYKRNLQKSYINLLIDMMEEVKKQSSYARRFGTNIDYASSDIKPIFVGKIFPLNRKIKNKIKRTRDDATSNHLKYISMQLSEFIDD